MSMKQLKQNKLCYWCFGCNKLEIEEFAGIIMKCKNFVPAYENWQECFYKELKKEKNK